MATAVQSRFLARPHDPMLGGKGTMSTTNAVLPHSTLCTTCTASNVDYISKLKRVKINIVPT